MLREALAVFQSTCPARGTTANANNYDSAVLISIHVPREGHDPFPVKKFKPLVCISIHVPREGHD